ncbi:MAG: PilZ domain-containing protein [Proteobacteria bacterium]|nr:PilZ domain-containing protein [Pseudomonadota bacterium]
MPPVEDNGRKFFRYEVDAPVNGIVGGVHFQARLKDVSATGAAVTVGIDVVLDNNQFVQLHMDGIGHRSGYKARDIPNGFAFEFAEQDETSKAEIEARIQALKKIRRGLEG